MAPTDVECGGKAQRDAALDWRALINLKNPKRRRCRRTPKFAVLDPARGFQQLRRVPVETTHRLLNPTADTVLNIDSGLTSTGL